MIGYRRGVRWVKQVKNNLKIVALLMLGLACAPKTEPVSTDCVINEDQASTFSGRWAVAPVPLAVEVNDFNDTEIAEIVKAIDHWNNFFNQSKKFKLFLSGSNSLSLTSSGGTRVTKATLCGSTVVTPSGFSNSLKIYKIRSAWPNGSQVMALTSFCPIVRPGAQFREFTNALMEVNYQNYFVAGKPIPDLQSIVLHELGHMLGLNHSCNGSDCEEAPDNYVEAVMYPSLGFDGIYGRVKRTLKLNDQQRANCLY
jgi:hypothetical protein